MPNFCSRLFVISSLISLGWVPPAFAQEKKQSINPEAQIAADLQLFMEPAKAITELITRLRAKVKVRDGLLIVDDLLVVSGLTVLPLNSSWTVSCGIGFTVTLGNTIGGSSDDVHNDVKVWLSFAGPIPKQNCEPVAVAVGKEILAILAGS
jgi:hypothetical protein